VRNCFCHGRGHLKGISKRDLECVLMDDVIDRYNSE